MNVPLIIILAALAVAFGSAILSRRGVSMNLEQWSIGGRGFSPFLVFVLMAGEVFTTSALLGASGLAYNSGGAAFSIVIFLTQAFMLSYWLLPAVWKFASKKGLITQPDFFAAKYNSPTLALLVAVMSLLALFPYLVLQLKGLGILVQMCSYGRIAPEWAILVGAIAMAAYVVASGMHGSATTAIIKDVMILVVCVFLGLYLPFHYYGGLAPMFKELSIARPGFFALSTTGKSLTWYLSTVFVSSLAVFMWPHTFSSAYTARSANHLKRNAVVMPLYTLMQLFPMLVGVAAVLQIPGLKGSHADLALLQLSLKTFSPWFIGVIGAAGLLTALVPSSIMLISASSVFSRNVYGLARPGSSSREQAKVAKIATVAFALIAVFLAVHNVESIFALLVMGYTLVVQIVPSLFMSFRRENPVNKWGAFVGILLGAGTVAYSVLTGFNLSKLVPGTTWLADVNMGIAALLLNVIAMFVVSAITRRYAVGSAAVHG
ncbi:sodium:solute symporter family protein [Paraburkholderia sediminicola]|uniref:sodium:solute symporter family protein n=1 Tax=Paraburkholderia sediminicola TaxID=458836 RepID=UPI0038B7F9F5